MANTAIKPCIISTHEAQALAVGDSLTLAVLSDSVCPTLRQADVDTLQDQFKKVIESPLKAIAYLWRPESVEVIRADQSLATLETCQNTATPYRCEAVKAYAEGHMSQMIIEEELGATGVVKCDWRTRLSGQDREWFNYFSGRKADVGNKAPSADGQLFDTLLIMGDFVKYSGLVFEENNPGMQDMACFQKMDCDVVSTRVIDHLRQVGQQVSGKISVVEIPVVAGTDIGHVTLQITTADGEFLYFDNANDFLPGIPYQGISLHLDPWQISSAFYTQLLNSLLEKNNYSAAKIIAQKAREINPNDANAYGLGGEIFFDQGDIEGAIREGQKSLVFDSQNGSTHIFLAKCLQEKGDIARAITEYKAGLLLKPDTKKVHYVLASLYYQRGNIEKAISELKEELAIDPQNTEVRESLADLTRWKWLYQAKLM